MRLVHAKSATVHVLPIQRLDGRICPGRLRELDEAEPSRSPCLPICDHVYRVERTVCLEELSKVLLGSRKG